MTDPRDVLRGFFESVWNAHDIAAFERFVAPDVVFHRPHGAPTDLDGWRHAATGFMAAFPDIRFTIEQVVAEGDTVVARAHMTGTHDGPLHGWEPTGRRFTAEARPWCRVRDGRIVEFWSHFDELGMMIDLDLVPATARSFGGTPEARRDAAEPSA